MALVRRLLLCSAVLLAGCGYHVAGKADLVPKDIRTVAVPPFGNTTTRYKLTDQLASAMARELLARGRFRVVNEPGEADAVLSGSLISYLPFPAVFDARTGRSSGVQFFATLSVTLTDRRTGKVLYQNPALQVRERYEISVQPELYFDESDAALERVSRQVARRVVSAVLEGF
jgi:outer membrane lipopolysaccharide assembly protein LptE/RlpB